MLRSLRSIHVIELRRTFAAKTTNILPPGARKNIQSNSRCESDRENLYRSERDGRLNILSVIFSSANILPLQLQTYFYENRGGIRATGIRIACVPLHRWKEITTTPTYNVAAIKNVREEIMSGYWRAERPAILSFLRLSFDSLRVPHRQTSSKGKMPGVEHALVIAFH